MQLIRLTTLVFTFVTSMNTQGAVKDVSQTAPTVIETASAQVRSVEEVVRTYFSDIPLLADVARCESTFRQESRDGDVLRGIANKDDVGVMQINEKYHLDEAVRLGYNLYTLDGNMAFARYLYGKYGISPWSASQKCWGKTYKVLAEK